MQRRSFVQASLATACSAAATAPAAAAERQGNPVYELRIYSLKPGKQPVLDSYLSKASIPALKRLGIGPVGVFVEKGKDGGTTVYTLIVYPSADAVTGLSAQLTADEKYLMAAKDYLAAP